MPTGPLETGLEMFDAAPVGVCVTTGPDHVVLYTNAVYRSIFGQRPVGLPMRESSTVAVDLDRILAFYDHVVRTGRPITTGDQPIPATYRQGDEVTTKWLSVSYSPITVADHAPGVLVVAADVTDRVLQEERIARLARARRRITERCRTLGRVGTQMMMVTDASGAVIEHRAGWEAVTGQRLEQLVGYGWAEAIHQEDRKAVIEAWQQAMSEKPPVWQHDFRLSTVDRGYRHHRARAVPVYDHGEVVEWVGIVADVEEEHQAARREGILERASAATSGLTSLDAMLNALGQVIVPTLADSCRVFVPREVPAGRTTHLVEVDRAAAVFRPGLPPSAPEGLVVYHPDTALARAILERQPSISVFPRGEPPRGIAPQRVLDWLRAVGANCLIAIPVIVDGAVAAAAAITVCDDRPPPDATDRALIAEVFEHAHDALSSAIAFHRNQVIASAMQHIHLTEPPEVPGLEIAACYRPTTSGAEVGGDWYDCFERSDGCVVLNVGDVAGHDLPAAVTMSQLRTVLRGLASELSYSCGENLSRLNAAMGTLYTESTATCVLARLTTTPEGARLLDYANAGHPPPLLLSADGRARFLEAGHNPLLGLPTDTPFDFAEEPFPDGATLLLYTDGLIEKYDEHLDAGMERLRLEAELLADEPVDAFCNTLLARLPSGTDDVAMIAVRAHDHDGRTDHR